MPRVRLLGGSSSSSAAPGPRLCHCLCWRGWSGLRLPSPGDSPLALASEVKSWDPAGRDPEEGSTLTLRRQASARRVMGSVPPSVPSLIHSPNKTFRLTII